MPAKRKPQAGSSTASKRKLGDKSSDFEESDSQASSYEPSPKKKAKKSKFRQKSSPDAFESPSAVQHTEKSKISHSASIHLIHSPLEVQTALLQWYAGVHASRGMPWRKPYNPLLGPDERAQRAYEVWVSEIMLQQTQVATVIPYYTRWMEKFPTIRDLAAATVDEVNALWKGLGYYSRASRLLAGAQKAVAKYQGRLPDNAKDMEANIPGIGRYSAGAICSIAYGEHVPVLDGNVHRLMSRFLAVHAPPKSKATLDILWGAAAAMVKPKKHIKVSSAQRASSPESTLESTRYPGDINQALIELGRLLAGLYEFPTSSDVAKTTSRTAQAKIPHALLTQLVVPSILPYDAKRKETESQHECIQITSIKPVGDVIHVFSHIRKTYRTQWVIIRGGETPPKLKIGGFEGSTVPELSFTDGGGEDGLSASPRPLDAMWVPFNKVSSANMGTGVVKVWNSTKELWERDIDGS
ncbi:hypothetical protein H0H81_000096 [Sphagnurus paluster]|uniref:Adenine DNA glycosylase n=1 Tax=Sphagnurus paluster TaxID=117069 RepID=A0A9P7KPK7_9AGAR|nr:hypothetical protein H0H81_000096 [Sphagnurus paluster]